jgi:5-methylthioadenosine/S-adenosylhomocysteine deaminase
MKLLISNALIVPMTEQGLSFHGDIGIDGKHIAFVGSNDPSFIPDRIIDALLYRHAGFGQRPTHLSMA